jgi:hypothetical protein
MAGAFDAADIIIDLMQGWRHFIHFAQARSCARAHQYRALRQAKRCVLYKYAVRVFLQWRQGSA